MGMTIDEAISDLTELKICGVVPFTKGTISGGNYKAITGDCLDTAIDTMRKYQKIEQLISDYEEYGWEEIDIKDIRVIINGNDD